jgi:hypothetical protein
MNYMNTKINLLKAFLLPLLFFLGISHNIQALATPLPHEPIVTDLGNGNFKVDETTKKLRPTLTKFSKLAFLMRKKDPLVAKLLAEYLANGWDITVFKGKSGKNNAIDDEPGFVAYHAKDNLMIVTFRGSDSSVYVTPKSKLSADWEVNFDYKLIDTPYGKMHKGFYEKTKAALPDLWLTMKKYITSLPPEKKASLQIYFTGHSQGAALAPLAAGFIAETIKKSKFLGPNFDNKKSNTLKVYVFSAPRVLGDEKAIQWFNNILGKENVVRQNVIGHLANDPVTVISLGKTSTAALQLIPVIGQYIAQAYGGGAEIGAGSLSFGYLAGDRAEDVFARLTPHALEAYQKQLNKGGLQSIPSTIKRAVIGILGTLHYGGTIKQTGTDSQKKGPAQGSSAVEPLEEGHAFTSVLAMQDAPPIEKLLKQGYEHKIGKRSGIRGAIRSGIETTASIKVSAENKVKCFALCTQITCRNPKTFEKCQKSCPRESIKNCTIAYQKVMSQKKKVT